MQCIWSRAHENTTRRHSFGIGMLYLACLSHSIFLVRFDFLISIFCQDNLFTLLLFNLNFSLQNRYFRTSLKCSPFDKKFHPSNQIFIAFFSCSIGQHESEATCLPRVSLRSAEGTDGSGGTGGGSRRNRLSPADGAKGGGATTNPSVSRSSFHFTSRLVPTFTSSVKGGRRDCKCGTASRSRPVRRIRSLPCDDRPLERASKLPDRNRSQARVERLISSFRGVVYNIDKYGVMLSNFSSIDCWTWKAEKFTNFMISLRSI